MREQMASTNEELDFWYKYEDETETFVLLFTSPSDHHLIKMYFSKKLMERFIDESLSFFIDTMNREDDEEEEDDEDSPRL